MEGKKLFRNTVKIGVDFGFAKVKHAAGHDKMGNVKRRLVHCQLSVVPGDSSGVLRQWLFMEVLKDVVGRPG